MEETQSQPTRKRRYPVAKIKGGWTPLEDDHLKQLVEQYQEGNWSVIARALNAIMGKPEAAGRIGKQCRERWNHHLKPGIRTDAWQEDEEALLVEAHIKFGNKWSDIARCIPGRTENAIKNHWNATLRRKETPVLRSLALKAGVPQTVTLKNYMQRINLLPSDDCSDLDSSSHPPALPVTLPPLGIPRLVVQRTVSNPSGSTGSPVHSTQQLSASPVKRRRVAEGCPLPAGPSTPPASSGSATSSVSQTTMGDAHSVEPLPVAPVKGTRSGRAMFFSEDRASAILQHIKVEQSDQAVVASNSVCAAQQADIRRVGTAVIKQEPVACSAQSLPPYPTFATTIFSLSAAMPQLADTGAAVATLPHRLSRGSGSSNRLDAVAATAMGAGQGAVAGVTEEQDIQAAEIMLALHAMRDFADKPAATLPPLAPLVLPPTLLWSSPPLPSGHYLGPSITL